VSVASLTRQAGIDFLRLAPEIGIVTQTTPYPLNEANQALADLRAGRFDGAAVLVPGAASNLGDPDTRPPIT
jgi:alcohol dehydrogenase, propanol-preferring